MIVNLADFARPGLRRLLAQCTEKQQAFFTRVFPEGIDALTEEKIKGAIALVLRTLKKNAEDAQ